MPSSSASTLIAPHPAKYFSVKASRFSLSLSSPSFKMIRRLSWNPDST